VRQIAKGSKGYEDFESLKNYDWPGACGSGLRAACAGLLPAQAGDDQLLSGLDVSQVGAESLNMERQKDTSKPEALPCVACDLPFGRVQVGKGLVITSRHNSHTHTNVLTPSELRRLADQIEQAGAQIS
jgi:hypothetical protein